MRGCWEDELKPCLQSTQPSVGRAVGRDSTETSFYSDRSPGSLPSHQAFGRSTGSAQCPNGLPSSGPSEGYAWFPFLYGLVAYLQKWTHTRLISPVLRAWAGRDSGSSSQVSVGAGLLSRGGENICHTHFHYSSHPSPRASLKQEQSLRRPSAAVTEALSRVASISEHVVSMTLPLLTLS